MTLFCFYFSIRRHVALGALAKFAAQPLVLARLFENDSCKGICVALRCPCLVLANFQWSSAGGEISQDFAPAADPFDSCWLPGRWIVGLFVDLMVCWLVVGCRVVDVLLHFPIEMYIGSLLFGCQFSFCFLDP